MNFQFQSTRRDMVMAGIQLAGLVLGVVLYNVLPESAAVMERLRVALFGAMMLMTASILQTEFANSPRRVGLLAVSLSFGVSALLGYLTLKQRALPAPWQLVVMLLAWGLAVGGVWAMWPRRVRR